MSRTLLLFLIIAIIPREATTQERCGVTASLVKSGFERDEQPQTVVFPAQAAPLTLSVEYPTEGAVINGAQIQLYGSFTGPANTGITVNGVQVAATNVANFTFAPIILSNGPQTLTISA